MLPGLGRCSCCTCLLLRRVPSHLRLVSPKGAASAPIYASLLFLSFLSVHTDTEVKYAVSSSMDLPGLPKFLTETGQICKLLLEVDLVIRHN